MLKMSELDSLLLVTNHLRRCQNDVSLGSWDANWTWLRRSWRRSKISMQRTSWTGLCYCHSCRILWPNCVWSMWSESECARTFKETNMKVIKTPKFDLWQLFWKGSNKRMNHSVPFTAAVRALSARLWKEILIGLAEAEFVPESAMNLCCTDCAQCRGGSWSYIFGTAPLCSNLTTIVYSHFIC